MKKTTIGIIASIISILGICFILTVNTHAEKTKSEKKEVPTYAIHSDYTLDVDNPNEVVGDANHVFVGKVTKETGTDYKNKTPMEQEDGSIEYIGEAYTNYKVEVISNLKNELAMDKEIALQKQGGIREDGSAYDVFEDDQLPEVGKIYLFNAYIQDDGSLLVAGGNSTISFDEKTKNIDTEKEVSKTEEFELYEEAVENQVTSEEN
ncbi:cell surface protein [Listeria welshimeri]|uniref:cell surface protein n=1 Tax=Listeria welshimeri TaxID=1643 RepID=UPI001628C60C|nr:cell surface protein [Listeria welshimeri]MBC1674193.1 cell surface protein [Listeria welshimeri]MBF2367805.1 cell surface protein [Listeria welshimeri]MBF2471195.1 cell surface protein [Listeria welshimeri]